MISYVRGPLVDIFEDSVVIEAGNVGLCIFVPLSLFGQLPPLGEEILLYTYFQVREDAMSLYGFLSRQDLLMFRQLIGVNGIGPKGALGVLSVLNPDELRMAIISGDAKTISRAPGIGAKTAQRVILDLKDKVHMEDILPATVTGTATLGVGSVEMEAIEALIALGYSGLEASRAVKKVVVTDGMTAEGVLKASLRHMSFL